MSTRAPAWFETKFKTGAIHVMQAQGYLTKGLFCEPVQVNGLTVNWKIAGSGEAQPMTFGEVGERPVLNADRQLVPATMQAWEANEWIGAVEPHLMSENEQQVAQKTCAMAIGRRFDKIPLGVLDTAAGSISNIGTGATNLGIDQVLQAQADILDPLTTDLELTCLLPWKQLQALALQKGFSSADYVTDSPLMKRIQARRWNGILFIPAPSSYFNVPAANQYDFYMWARDAVGFATATDAEGKVETATRIDYVPQMKQWFVANTMMAASALIQAAGVRRFRMSSNTALAGSL